MQSRASDRQHLLSISEIHNYRHHKQETTVLVIVCGFRPGLECFLKAAMKNAKHTVTMCTDFMEYVLLKKHKQ